MKKLAVILAALTLLVAGATSALAEITVSGSAYAALNTKYLWRGMDLTSEDGNFVVQPGVNVSTSGFTFSYWSNYDENLGDVNETDLTLDYTFSPIEQLTLSVGNIFYSLEGVDDTNELYVKVIGNVLLAPTFAVYCDWDEANETGLFFTASIGHSFELTDALALNLGALVSYNAESDYSVGNYNDFHHGEVSVGLAWEAVTNLTVTPAVIYSFPLSDEAEDLALVGGVDHKVLAGVTLAYSF